MLAVKRSNISLFNNKFSSSERCMSRNNSLPSAPISLKSIQQSSIKPTVQYTLTENLFTKKIKSLFTRISTKKLNNTEIINSAIELANNIKNDLYTDKKGIYRQQPQSHACGFVSHLNSIEQAYRNSIISLKSIINNINLSFEHLPKLIENIEQIAENNKEFFLGNDNLENELVELKSLLYASQDLLFTSDLHLEIATKVSLLENKLNNILINNNPFFNNDDVIYSSLKKIYMNEDAINNFKNLSSNYKSYLAQRNNDIKLTNLPDSLLNIVQSSTVSKDNLFNYSYFYKDKTQAEQSLESIKNDYHYKIYGAKLDIIMFMMKNYSKKSNLEFKQEISNYLNHESNKEILELLANELCDFSNKNSVEKINLSVAQIPTIVEHSIDYFNRVQQYGILLNDKVHFTSLLYDKQQDQFKLINPYENSISQNLEGTAKVLEFLKDKKHQTTTNIFSIIKRDDKDAFVSKLNSSYELYFNKITFSY